MECLIAASWVSGAGSSKVKRSEPHCTVTGMMTLVVKKCSPSFLVFLYPPCQTRKPPASPVSATRPMSAHPSPRRSRQRWPPSQTAADLHPRRTTSTRPPQSMSPPPCSIVPILTPIQSSCQPTRSPEAQSPPAWPQGARNQPSNSATSTPTSSQTRALRRSAWRLGDPVPYPRRDGHRPTTLHRPFPISQRSCTSLSLVISSHPSPDHQRSVRGPQL